jgi:hypothetical protein
MQKPPRTQSKYSWRFLRGPLRFLIVLPHFHYLRPRIPRRTNLPPAQCSLVILPSLTYAPESSHARVLSFDNPLSRHPISKPASQNPSTHNFYHLINPPRRTRSRISTPESLVARSESKHHQQSRHPISEPTSQNPSTHKLNYVINPTRRTPFRTFTPESLVARSESKHHQHSRHPISEPTSQNPSTHKLNYVISPARRTPFRTFTPESLPHLPIHRIPEILMKLVAERKYLNK